MPDGERDLSQSELAGIADELLERAGEDNDALARELRSLDPAARNQILVSDFLNAFQVYYYFFSEDPGELERDRLLLQPASALAHGVLIAEVDCLEVKFHVEDGEPVLIVSDGEQVLANFRGRDAPEKARRFIDESL